MRIYEGSPREDYGGVFRALGAHLDELGMREILLLETHDGFVIQGLAIRNTSSGWSDSLAQMAKETLVFGDEDISRLMDESEGRRGTPPSPAPRHYEAALRVIGQYLDERKPRDVFFFEQDGAYVLRLFEISQARVRHELVEFTKDDIDDMIARSPALRRQGILGR
jgi:hypothetical protein